MLPPAEIREELTVRAFALIKAFLAGDLVALDALVDDDTELILVLMEILVGALLKLVSVEELSRQVDQWLDERRTRLVG
jgi:ADP-ribosylglycohydrolase